MRNSRLPPRFRLWALLYLRDFGCGEGAATVGEDWETYPAGPRAGGEEVRVSSGAEITGPHWRVGGTGPGFLYPQAYHRLGNRWARARYARRASRFGTLFACCVCVFGPLSPLFDCGLRGRFGGRRIFGGIGRPIAGDPRRLGDTCPGNLARRLAHRPSCRGAAKSITMHRRLMRNPRIHPRLRLRGLISPRD